MVRISEGECQQQWNHIQDLISAEPVTVTRDGLDRMVILSAEEYHRLKRRDRKVMGLEDFAEKDLQDLRRMEPPPESAAFNHEMKD